jgi:micrococcal nuclease
MKKIIKVVILAILAILIVGTTAIKDKLEEFGIDTSVIEEMISNTTIPDVTENSQVLNGPYAVKRIVDGDTIVVTIDGIDEKIRMIGVDTPESVHVDESKNTDTGKIASEYTVSQLTGKYVYLEYDEDKYDNYNRILAYVYTADDGEMYNLHLIEAGMAKTMTIEPNTKYEMTFSEAEKTANENDVGFWDTDW